MPMNPEIKKQWVERLRSGEYKQERETLVYTDTLTGEKSYCCLGVLCTLIPDLVENEHDFYFKNRVFDSTGGIELVDFEVNRNDNNSVIVSGYPGPVVYKMVDLESEVAMRLARMNDAERKSFNEIADYIEENL